MAGPRGIRVEPLYTMAEAARYVGVKPTTYKDWARGYVRRFPDRPPVRRGPLIDAVQRPPGAPSVSFMGLTESLVVAAIRKTGLPMQRIRPAVRVLQQEIGLEFALASKRLYSDGAEIVFDYANRYDDDELGTLTVVRSGQTVFREVITDYLRRIVFDDDEWATRLFLPITTDDLLEVNPTRGFGRPLFEHGGAPMDNVIGRLKAGDSTDAVARDFEIPVAEVQEVERVLIEA